MLTLQREEDHVTDRSLSGQQHDKPIDADADSGGRRHAVFERSHVVPIRFRNLLIPAGSFGDLRFEARPLIVGIVEFGEGVRNFHACAEKLVAIGQLRIGRPSFGKGRDQNRIARNERRSY